MDLRDIISTLIEAAEKETESLVDNIEQSEDEGNMEALAEYKQRHADTWQAIDAARDWLKNTENGKPVRVIVDFSSGLFNGATSNVRVDVLAIDTDDNEHIRADVPGFGDVWAGYELSEIDADAVNAAFDGIKWLEDEETANG